MDLVAVAVWSFMVALAGGVAGLVLGNLRLPVVPQFSSSAAAAAGSAESPAGLSLACSHEDCCWQGVDWDLLAAGCVGAVPGAWLGAQLTGRLDDRTLLQTIAAILVVAGIALGVQAALA